MFQSIKHCKIILFSNIVYTVMIFMRLSELVLLFSIVAVTTAMPTDPSVISMPASPSKTVTDEEHFIETDSKPIAERPEQLDVSLYPML